MERRLVDVSYAQGVFDWEAAKPFIDGAIIRCCSYSKADDASTAIDVQFKRNADECTRLGIPFGLYVFSYAASTGKAEAEAAKAIELAKPYRLSYPIFFDSEDASTKAVAAKCANAFCAKVEAAEYMSGVYASRSWWGNYLVGVKTQAKWVASWGSNNGQPQMNYKPDCDIWQYTSKATLAGRRVDMNICYRDFPSEINPEPAPKPEPKPEPVIVEDDMKVEIGGNNVPHKFDQEAYSYTYEKFDDGRLKMLVSDYFNPGVGKAYGNGYYMEKALPFPSEVDADAPKFVGVPFVIPQARAHQNLLDIMPYATTEKQYSFWAWGTQRAIPRFSVDFVIEGRWK